jgi:Zn-dependent peptidase ImmA (M78 family)
MTPPSERNNDNLTPGEYYRTCVQLAQSKRHDFGVITNAFGLREMRKIYKQEKIAIDLRKLRRAKIRAAYYCDDGECSVLVNSTLPSQQRLFAMAHELKHHFMDQPVIQGGEFECGDYNANVLVEKGAEVFAAEFLYPLAEMKQLLGEMEITSSNSTAENLVRFKRVCPADVSYKFIVKRFEFLGLATPNKFATVKWEKLEERIFGIPFYKTQAFKDARGRTKYLNPP